MIAAAVAGGPFVGFSPASAVPSPSSGTPMQSVHTPSTQEVPGSSQRPPSLPAVSTSTTSSSAAVATSSSSSSILPLSSPLSINRGNPNPPGPSPTSSSLAPIAPAPTSLHQFHQPVLQPSPIMPYPQHPPAPQGPPPTGMHIPPQGHSQIVCTGCRTWLVYPNNASNVRCALCTTITAVPPSGTEMSQLVCGGCHRLLMYMRGASSVQCSCCHSVNLAMESSQVEHITCGGCGMALMYPYGAQSVKCAVCQFVTSVSHMNAPPRMPLPMHQPMAAQQQASGSGANAPRMQQGSGGKTIVVENPMSLDENGKLVSNVAVGVTSEKK